MGDNKAFSLAILRDEIIKKSLGMNVQERKINFDKHTDILNYNELKNVLGPNAITSILENKVEKNALQLKVNALDLTKFKKYTVRHILSYVDNFYFLGLSTGALFNLSAIAKSGAKKARITVSVIVNHSVSSCRLVEIKEFWRLYSKNPSKCFEWLCKTNEYILFNVLNTDKNYFYENINHCINKYAAMIPEYLINRIQKAATEKDISAYVILVLYSMYYDINIENFDNQIFYDSIPDIIERQSSDAELFINEFNMFHENIMNRSGFISPMGTLDILRRTRDVSSGRVNNVDIYTLLLASDIYYRQHNLVMAKRCSQEAYNRNNRTIAAYNLGYYSYIELLRMDNKQAHQDFGAIEEDGISHLDNAFFYLSESAQNGFPSALTSLGNLCLLMTKNSASDSFILKNIHIYKGLVDVATDVGALDIKHVSSLYQYDDSNIIQKMSALKHLFYEKAASTGNLDAMYSCIRDIEKNIPRTLEFVKKGLSSRKNLNDELSKICKWHEKLVEYKHPKGVNSYCCYILATMGFEDLMPIWYKDLSSDDRKYVLSQYDKFRKNRNLSDSSILYALEQLKDVCFYDQDQLCYFWPMYHFAFLYNTVNKKHIVFSINNSTKYEYDIIIDIIEHALKNNILDKELFTISRREEVEILGYRLLYNVLARACASGEDIEKIEYHLLKNRQKFDAYRNQLNNRDIEIITKYTRQTDNAYIMNSIEEIKTLIKSL